MNKDDKIIYIVTKKYGKEFKVSDQEGMYIKELSESHSLIKTKNSRQITVQTKDIKNKNE